MTLIQSSEFRSHKLSLDALARENKGYVYLISRFDDDDSTICTFGSMGYRPEAIKTGLGGVARVSLGIIKNRAKIKPDEETLTFAKTHQKIASGQAVVRNPSQGGAHAEELFIRKLPQMFGEYGAPNKIEVFVSRIPCAKISSAWILESTTKGNVLLPTGCANKLFVLIKKWKPDIDWRFWWEEAYENDATQAECAEAMLRLNSFAIVQRYLGSGRGY